MSLADSHVASDADLVAAKSGDEVAFLRLYRTVQPGLLRYMTLIAGRDAEDVCADAWAQACRDLNRVKDTLEDFRPWIARIARNRALDLKRAQRRRPVDALEDEHAEINHSLRSAEDEALESLSTRSSFELIGTLPPDQAEAVALRAILGLDARAAGTVLGKSAGAVRTLSYRGLNTLAKSLTPPSTTDGPTGTSRRSRGKPIESL